MPVKKLTARAIEGLQSQAKREKRALYLWDEELRGFGVRASASGGLSWLFHYQTPDRPRRYSFGATDLEEARNKARSFKADVKSNIDPLARHEAERKALRDAASAETVAQAVARYFEAESKPGRYWPELKLRFEKLVIPKLDKSVVTVTREDIKSILLGHKPGAKRTLFVGLSSFFKWCLGEEIISDNPMGTLARPKGAKIRDRTLSDSELKAFWSATEGDRVFGPFHRLLLVTGQRRDEVAAIRWSEIDGDTWTIPSERTKNKKPHIVHLSPLALSLLPAKREGFDYVFHAPKRTKTRIWGFGRSKARLDALMPKNTRPWVIHDLRRSAASGMARLGFQPYIIDRVLNHAPRSEDRLITIYQTYEYLEERKRALEAWSQHLDNIISGITNQGNVIKFPSAG
jgi:integrase